MIGWARSLFAWALERLLGDSIVASALRVSSTKPVDELWRLQTEKDQYCEMFHREVCTAH